MNKERTIEDSWREVIEHMAEINKEREYTMSLLLDDMYALARELGIDL